MLNKRAKTKIEIDAASSVLDAALLFGWIPKAGQPQTGCWTFDAVNNQHVIRINEDCPATATRKTPSKMKYALAILEHERCHARYTTRDFELANKACRDANAPFMLFNLFEDARIEFLRRYGGAAPLQWLKFDRVITPTCPISALFSLMQREIVTLPPCSRLPADKITLGYQHPIYRRTPECRWIRKAMRGGLNSLIAHCVWTFYIEICRCEASLDLQPLMARWMQLFPSTSGPVIVNVTAGTGQAGEVFPERVAERNDPVPPANAPLAEVGGANIGRDGKAGRGVVVRNEQTEGIKLAALMSRSFRLSGDGLINSVSPSKRLNLRGLAEGRTDKPFRRMQTVDSGKPRVGVVVDLSGSMNADDGAPIQNARILLTALNKLTLDGVISCTAYATASGGCVNQVALPTRPSNFHWTAFSDSEGMNTFFGQKAAELSQCDVVLMFTDGCIGDRGSNLTFLHQRGIHVIGAYVARNGQHILTAGKQLKKYFDKVCVCKDLPNLAHNLAKLIASKS